MKTIKPVTAPEGSTCVEELCHRISHNKVATKRCGEPATVLEDKKTYCKQHDPMRLVRGKPVQYLWFANEVHLYRGDKSVNKIVCVEMPLVVTHSNGFEHKYELMPFASKLAKEVFRAYSHKGRVSYDRLHPTRAKAINAFVKSERKDVNRQRKHLLETSRKLALGLKLQRFRLLEEA